MADIAWSDVSAMAPELATLDIAAQTVILLYVNDEALNVDELGGEASATVKLARIYLAAHFGTVSRQGGAGAAGPVTSESAGDLSRSYATTISVVGSDPVLDVTPYGKAYRALINGTTARAPVVL